MEQANFQTKKCFSLIYHFSLILNILFKVVQKLAMRQLHEINLALKTQELPNCRHITYNNIARSFIKSDV